MSASPVPDIAHSNVQRRKATSRPKTRCPRQKNHPSRRRQATGPQNYPQPNSRPSLPTRKWTIRDILNSVPTPRAPHSRDKPTPQNVQDQRPPSSRPKRKCTRRHRHPLTRRTLQPTSEAETPQTDNTHTLSPAPTPHPNSQAETFLDPPSPTTSRHSPPDSALRSETGACPNDRDTNHREPITYNEPNRPDSPCAQVSATSLKDTPQTSINNREASTNFTSLSRQKPTSRHKTKCRFGPQSRRGRIRFRTDSPSPREAPPSPPRCRTTQHLDGDPPFTSMRRLNDDTSHQPQGGTAATHAPPPPSPRGGTTTTDHYCQVPTSPLRDAPGTSAPTVGSFAPSTTRSYPEPDRVTLTNPSPAWRTPFDHYKQTAAPPPVLNPYRFVQKKLGLSEAEFEANISLEIDEMLSEIDRTRRQELHPEPAPTPSAPLTKEQCLAYFRVNGYNFDFDFDKDDIHILDAYD